MEQNTSFFSRLIAKLKAMLNHPGLNKFVAAAANAGGFIVTPADT